MEAKLLQIAASLRTRFVLVISAEALKWLLAFLGHNPRFDPFTVYDKLAGEWMRPHCEEAGEGKKGGSVTATYWKSLLRARHEISVSSYAVIRTNCIVPFSVERVGTNIYLCDLLF